MHKADQNDTQDFLENGKQFLQKKQFYEAECAFRQAISQSPANAVCYFHLAHLFTLRGHPDLAFHSLTTARNLDPTKVEIWNAQAQAIRFGADQATFLADLATAPLPNKDIEAIAVFLGKRAQEKTPSLKPAIKKELARAAKFLRMGQSSQTIVICQRALKSVPFSPLPMVLLAKAFAAEGKTNTAQEKFKAAIDAQPQNGAIHGAFAAFLIAQRDFDAALPIARKALFLDRTPTHLKYLGQVLSRCRADFSGITILMQAAEQNPKDSEIYMGLADAFLSRNAPHQALLNAQKALKLGVSSPECLLLFIQAKIAIGEIEPALERLAEFLQSNPNNAHAHITYVNALYSEGLFDKALEAAQAFKKACPQSIEPLISYVKAKKLTADDPMIEQLKTDAEDLRLKPWERTRICYAAAKALEDVGDYAGAFSYFSKGAQSARVEISKKNIPLAQEVDAVIAATPLQPRPALKSSSSDACPIFITGLPRSGTTLVEQIISSHPLVKGGGELGLFPRIVYGAAGTKLAGMPPMALYPDRFFAEISTAYRDFLHTEFSGAQYVTDKSIMTFLYIGILAQAMPDAKVIIVRRDPRDNLLSIYKNLFARGTHGYAYDLKELGQHYHAFKRMIDFWHDRLQGWFYEIRYEDLISAPEAQSRRLIDFCGLSWDPACLNFHKAKRTIKTLSAYQVRQPIYKSSVQAWHRYRAQLAPLLKELGGS